MKTNTRVLHSICVLVLSLLFFLCLNPLFAQIERFQPRQGGTTEVWRITNDPTMRDWANYHNTDCWSSDGRYICYVNYEPYDLRPNSWHYLVLRSQKKVHIYDLHKDKDIKIDNGTNPRWANNHNWFFYIRHLKQDGSPQKKGTQVMWLDVDTNRLTRIAYGITNLGETDSGDRWLYGFKSWEGRERQGVRIPIRKDSRPEIIEGLKGIFWIPNPEYPVIFIRDDHRGFPFKATRYWCDLEGKNITIGSPTLQRCHQSWLGDGSYYLHGGTGGTLMSGRRWNEPFPSNFHVLTAIWCGDISPCGRSGRWISGSGNFGPLQIADLRSGDGWNYLKAALSLVHDSDQFGYAYGSAVHDNDAKGSPDGTKICFVSNYDLKDGSITEITENVSGVSEERIPVKSTEGFPETGRLSVRNEVIGYARKTPTSFEGLTRKLYGTRPSNLREGLIVTSFDARCIPEEQRKNLPLPSRFAREDFPDDKNSPLIWQNRTDVYVAVVRLPDQPHLRKIAGELELIPGENHWETYGYHIFRDGKKITNRPLRPGTSYTLPGAGTYTATAVEWSGLESKQGFPLQIQRTSTLRLRLDKPADFSWTSDRWLVDGKEVSEEEAKRSEEAVREVLHLLDGVIHREWYNWSQIIRRYDLNSEKIPIRRLFYHNGKLARREYHTREGFHVSTEFFNPDGHITESIQYQVVSGKSEERGHFWYKRCMPVKFVGIGGRHAAPQGKGTYVKEGERWVKID